MFFTDWQLIQFHCLYEPLQFSCEGIFYLQQLIEVHIVNRSEDTVLYGLNYVSLETEFEYFIFEFELLNNCIENLNLNGIIKKYILIWNWIPINLKLNVILRNWINLLWNCILLNWKFNSIYWHVQFSQFKFSLCNSISIYWGTLLVVWKSNRVQIHRTHFRPISTH